MKNFEIVTDFTAELYEGYFDQNPTDRVIMPYTVGAQEYDGRNNIISDADFYAEMRKGALTHTSQINSYDAELLLEKHLQQDKDILYISFSSGMSGSYDNITVLQQKLSAKYPNNTFAVVDSLSGAGGEGLLLYYAKKMQSEGKSLQEIVAWLEENKYNCHHIFIVDDLENLKRSGRISKISALVGMIIGVKPVLTLSYYGKVAPLAKTMGRKKAISTMISAMRKSFIAEKNDFVLVGNADCLTDAHALGDRIKAEFGITDIRYSTLTHLVGANVGPDALVVYYMGQKREKSILEMIKK